MLKILGEPKFYEKGGDNMVNDFDKKKDSKYTYNSIYN